MGKKTKGFGFSLAALAAAGAYFIYGKDAAKHRNKIKGWTLKMKGDLLSRLGGGA